MILVDPRFGSERKGQRSSHRIVAELLPALGVEVQSTPLEAGDFVFLGNGPESPIWIGTELKVVSDFVTSMLSGRLAEQLVKLSKFERRYLIIEGFYRARRGSGLLEVPRGGGWRPLNAGPRPVFWQDVEKFITGIEEAGIHVRRTRTSQETARVIAHVIYGFWQKDYDDHKSLDVIYRPQMFSLVREDETTRRLRQVAACLPGIGTGRSKLVAERFRSIEQLANAGAEEWEEIDGIGNKLAGDVTKAIRAVIPTPKRSVSARHRSTFRGARRAGKRAHRQLDASGRAQ